MKKIFLIVILISTLTTLYGQSRDSIITDNPFNKEYKKEFNDKNVNINFEYIIRPYNKELIGLGTAITINKGFGCYVDITYHPNESEKRGKDYTNIMDLKSAYIFKDNPTLITGESITTGLGLTYNINYILTPIFGFSIHKKQKSYQCYDKSFILDKTGNYYITIESDVKMNLMIGIFINFEHATLHLGYDDVFIFGIGVNI